MKIIYGYLDEADGGQATEYRVDGRPLSEPSRRAAPLRPSVHTLPGHVPHGPLLHRGRHSRFHRGRTAQFLKNANGIQAKPTRTLNLI